MHGLEKLINFVDKGSNKLLLKEKPFKAVDTQTNDEAEGKYERDKFVVGKPHQAWLTEWFSPRKLRYSDSGFYFNEESFVSMGTRIVEAFG